MLRATAGLAAHTSRWSKRVGGLACIPALMRELGADAAQVFAGAGLSSDALDHPEARVPYAALGRILRDAALRTRCPHFGLLVGRLQHVDDLGLVGELVCNSPRVGEALQTLVVYQHLNSGGGLAFLLERGATVDFGYAIFHPDVTGTDVIHDAWLAEALNLMRHLCGPGWLPSEVLIPHAAPRDASPYLSLFRTRLRFNAEICALRFSDRWLQRPIQGASPMLLAQARRRAHVSGKGQLLEQAFRALRLLMLQGDQAGDDVAGMLSMHRRTLNRRLKAEGTTFREVLDQVRFQVARQLLADSDIGLDDVAATLGYANVTPFMRSFRRWSGTTPGRWRQAAVAGRLLDIDRYRHAQRATTVYSYGNPQRQDFLCGAVRSSGAR